MLPSNVDPRRPDKVQRYTPKGNGQEDLTPDYMNLLGQHQTTANAGEAPDKHSEAAVSAEPNLHANAPHEESHIDEHNNSVAVTTTATNVIPTSPQYGVAILPNSAITTAYLPTETITSSTDTITDTSAKPPDEGKDLHSTPSRNDRFKVVKIASLEPFKRGRWKCMDYVDEQPPQSSQSKVSQSTGNLQMGASGVFLQTQSMPQQQIHQYLMQGGFTNGTQFFPNVQSQMIPQNQYFYPQVTNMQTQTLQQQQVPSSMPAQFINSNTSYYPGGVVPNPSGFNVPQSFPNMQYVQGIMQNQSSAFVPTSQTVQLPTNFQQSQTYAGQPNVSQSNVGQPLVNGHSFPSNEQQATTSSLPTQTAKSVILNSNIPQPVVSHPQINPTNVQNQIPMQNNSQGQSVPVIQSQQYQTATGFPQVQQQPQQNPNSNPVTVGLPSNMAQVVQPQLIQGTHVVPVQSQNFDQSVASNVYTNPQFVMSGSATSLTNLENNEASIDAVTEPNSITEPVSESADDPAKPNQVVNAIDNKIEQAMDLVKSHLMYTVREEVEVLKEKIAELMEKIQQLETENNFLKSQIPKTAATSATSNSNPINNQPPITQSNKPVSNPSPNVIPNTQPVVLQNPSADSAPTQ